ncbi:SDR family oxidoreductase [Sphingomonas naphthae]|uniref:SDR family oxidoreductase n=1 Tax=Sphingomonas naphthae TaxID=1813468 RepID=A0ABY7TIL9_9SPHN|nr:SDR family oxidoreductase [Sphingomonas naphthae]WCT72758.1 SDR family oxidoreductase [Sphingomonas naphthae]
MSGKESAPSRRDVFGGVAVAGAAGVALMGAGAAQAQGGEKIPPAPAVPGSPQSKYPVPPLPEQRQPWPALYTRMNPRPDHGETSYKGSGRLKGKRILVTGGDSGIGAAAAIAFAREGADVAINYHPSEEPDAREIVALIRKAGQKAVALPADIQTQGACIRLVADAVAQLGGLDVVVNNAAYQQSKASIDEITPEQFDQTFKTNIYAPFWITKAALAHLKVGASIINTASVNAFDPGEELLDYASTKGAIMIFTKGLAKQLAKRGIRVNAVAPGPVWTPLQVAGGQLPGKIGEFGANVPMGRPGQPAELAAIFVLLASDEIGFTTGSVYGAQGGKGTI